jgi:hypothetical protein
MHPSVRRLTAGIVIALSLGCSARGGGGNTTPIDGDAALPPGDLGAPDDATAAMDRVAPPADDGVKPVDTGKAPTDLGVPPTDLGVPDVCGDARCGGSETCMSCRQDCGDCAGTCGDGTCGGGESCTSCTSDCGDCPATCGDGSCNSGETCTSCPRDCGACPAMCGDGMCNGGETCTSCRTDCGDCPVNCAAVGTCGACTSNPGCGWCTFDGACQPGTNSGPTGTSSCAAFGGWRRTVASCTADAGVRDAGVPDTGAPDAGATLSITRTCGAFDDAEGTNTECGWVLAQSFTCSPGSMVTLGCTGGAATDGGSCIARLGSCSGDPMMRVCPGSGTQCSQGGRVPTITTTGYNEDDACGTCPVGRFACPSSGSLTVYQRRYYLDRAATCVIARG